MGDAQTETSKNTSKVCPPEAVGILDSPSYFLLDADARALVEQYAEEILPGKDDEAKHFKVDLKSAILNRRSLEQALDDGKDFLNTLDPATFSILACAGEVRYDAELEVIESKLKLLNYLVLMSAERAKETKNLPMLPEHRAYLERVTHMLVALRRAKRQDKSPLEGACMARDQDQPMRYFGMLYIAPAVTRAVENMTLNSVENKHEIILEYNDLRLYLTWANALAQCICNMISASVQVTLKVTRAVLQDLAFVTGSLGFILYFTTFGLASAIIFQNTFEIGLNKKVLDLELHWYERFKTQWEERKFLFLNNLIWGVVNFVCFFWLVGKGVSGFWGNVLTDVLFVLDLFLVCWQFNEDETEHWARLKFYDDGIDALSEKIKALSQEDPNNPYIARLQLEQGRLQDAQKKLDQKWTYHNQKHKYNLAYGIGIMLGFAMLCSFFFPPAIIAPFTVIMLGLVGASFCFALGVASKALSGHVIQQEDMALLDESKTSYASSLELFNDIADQLKASPKATELLQLQTESKLAYLSLKKSLSTMHYQQQAVDYQRAQIVCNILTDIILPSIFVLAFVFMPLGVGMPMFAVGLAMLFYANWQVAEMAPEGKKPEFFASLDKFGAWLFSKKIPEEKQLEQFNIDEYDDFCKRVDAGEEPYAILKEQLKAQPSPQVLSKPFDTDNTDICPDAG